jgi:hypothetical protein
MMLLDIFCAVQSEDQQSAFMEITACDDANAGSWKIQFEIALFYDLLTLEEYSYGSQLNY